MTDYKGIPIKNVYYMLTYAFDELRKKQYDDIDKEDFENIQDLFAEILYRGMSMQLKQGLHREYVLRNDSLSTLRGKLDIVGTIANRIKQKPQLACEFDDNRLRDRDGRDHKEHGNQNGCKILRNTRNGSPRRRSIRRLELPRHAGQSLEVNAGRKHFGKHRYS